MSMRSMIVALAAAVVLPFSAFAESHTHPGAKVTFDTPDAWVTEVDGEVLNTKSADDEAAIMFTVVEGDQLAEALDAAEKGVKEFVKDAKVENEDGVDVTVNGMAGKAIEGKGTVEGAAVEFGVLVLKTKAGKFLFVLGMAKAGGKHQKEIDSIFQSIKST